MASLSAHLRQGEAHAALAFRPDCPTCLAERLAGEMPSDQLMSRRVPALATAAVLAVSGSAPGLAVAREPDRQYEGSAAPEDPTAPERDDPDPGGPATQLPSEPEAPQARVGPPDDDVEPLEPEVPQGRGEVVVDQDDATESSDRPEPSAPVESAETVSAPSTPPPTATPPVAPATLPPPAAVSPTAVAVPVAPQLGPVVVEQRASAPTARQRARSIVARLRPGAAFAARHQQAARAEQLSSAPRPPAERRSAANSDGGVHEVRRGESLWSIASDILGPGASPAQIARLVHRLWELNKDRIGTGDPNLIMAGTELRLP